MKPTSPRTLKNVTNCIEAGQSTRQIASTFGLGKSTVGDIRKRLFTDLPKVKSGRKPKLSDRDKRAAVSIVLRGKAKSAVEAAKILNEDLPNKVCAETVRRALRAADLVARKKKKKPFLSVAYRRNRLRWAV